MSSTETEWTDKFGRHYEYRYQAPNGQIFSRKITHDPDMGWTVTWDECRKSVMVDAALAAVKQASGEGEE